MCNEVRHYVKYDIIDATNLILFREEKADTAGLAFNCDECDKNFKSSRGLEKHLQGHTGFCNMCNQVYSEH